MKDLFLLSVAAIVVFPIELSAQNSAAAALEQNADYERYRALSAKISDMLENQQLILRRQQELDLRLGNLSRDVEALKERSARAPENVVTRDELKQYVDKLKEIDGKREADKALLLKSIRDLAKLPVAAAPSRGPSHGNSGSGTTFDYEVKPGEFLGEIVKYYNLEFEKQGLRSISVKQVEDANPGLNPDRILVGQVIKIPEPEKK